jgi:hypothetical protein
MGKREIGGSHLDDLVQRQVAFCDIECIYGYDKRGLE